MSTHAGTLKCEGQKAGHLLSAAVTNHKALTPGSKTKKQQTFTTASVSQAGYRCKARNSEEAFAKSCISVLMAINTKSVWK